MWFIFMWLGDLTSICFSDLFFCFDVLVWFRRLVVQNQRHCLGGWSRAIGPIFWGDFLYLMFCVLVWLIDSLISLIWLLWSDLFGAVWFSWCIFGFDFVDRMFHFLRSGFMVLFVWSDVVWPNCCLFVLFGLIVDVRFIVWFVRVHFAICPFELMCLILSSGFIVLIVSAWFLNLLSLIQLVEYRSVKSDLFLIWFGMDIHLIWILHVFVDLNSVFSSVQCRSRIWHVWSDLFWSDFWELNSAGAALGRSCKGLCASRCGTKLVQCWTNLDKHNSIFVQRSWRQLHVW